MVATALVLLGIVAWLWQYKETRGEPARFLLSWLVLVALSALAGAAGMWIGDASVSQSFAAAERLFLMGAVFLLFLFARSFSEAAGFALLYWSIPLQLGTAVIVWNWQSLFVLSGGSWVMDMGEPAALLTVAVNWFYGVMAFVYAAILYLTLRREGRGRESGRTLIMVSGIVVLFVASGLQGSISGAAGYAVSIAYLGQLAGVLLLVWAFRGPRIFRTAER
jgi:hypothetical protein